MAAPLDTYQCIIRRVVPVPSPAGVFSTIDVENPFDRARHNFLYRIKITLSGIESFQLYKLRHCG